MRKHIEKIPDGTYSFSSDIDSDGVDDRPLTVALDMTVRGDGIEFDLSRSSPPCRGPMNSVWAITRSAIYIALKHIFPDVPINAGCFCATSHQEALRNFPLCRIPTARLGLCGRGVAAADRSRARRLRPGHTQHQVVAAPFSSSGNFTLGGWDPQFRRNYVMINFSGGGYGASTDLDGLSNAAASISAAKTMPLELIENIYPVLYEHYRLSRELWRSRTAARRPWHRLQDAAPPWRGQGILPHGSRQDRPHGLLGAQRGSTNHIELERDGKIETLPLGSKGSGIEMRPGDKVRVTTPGGGGYGEPRDRAPALVKRDVLRGYISKEQAQTAYGVNL